MASILKVDEIQHTDGSTAVTAKVNESRQCAMAFMVTTGQANDNNPVTGWTNMATQLSGDGAGQITRGGAVSESSGTFTMPFTGLWSVEYYTSIDPNAADNTIQMHIQTTQDNSSYSDLAQAKTSASGDGRKATAHLRVLWNCTSTTSDKVRFRHSTSSGHIYEGSTTEALTYVIFQWLGDAD